MIQVDDSHFAYLALQRGRQADLIGDRAVWQSAYEDALAATLQSIRPHLPFECASVLDVGGGLGGIDVLLSHEFPGIAVTILDGESDPPVMELHRRTFNHMGVARDFLAKNGVNRFDYFTPALGEARPFDLIVSFGSWCFHFAPETYLEFVASCCRLGTVLILEVRRQQPEWREVLERRFSLRAVAAQSAKFERLVFDAR